MAKKKNSETVLKSDSEITRKITRYQNLDDNEIIITESKLENILIKHSRALRAGSDWKTPSGLIIAIIATFLTTEFNKNFLGFSAQIWCAFFIFIFFGSIIWFFRSLCLVIVHRKQNIKTLIKLIKDEQNS